MNRLIFISVIALFAYTYNVSAEAATLEEKFNIAKHWYALAKNALRIPAGVGFSMAPTLIFAHYAPTLAMGSTASIVAVVGIGGLLAGTIGAEISTSFNKN